LMECIKTGEEGATDLEADFLCALAHTTPFPKVQQAAEHTLERLAARGIQPVTRAILDLGQDHFYAAYTSDPNHPWQQSVTVAWERAGGVIQALVFLLDFGAPWRGALKDAFATHGMTPQQFQRDLVDRATRSLGEPLLRISLASVQATISAAVQANRQNNIPLPKEFNEARHLVERWVLHPPAAALAADTTSDELGDLPVPDRNARPLMFDLGDLQRSETARHWFAQQAASAAAEAAAEAGDEEAEWDEEIELSDAEIERAEEEPELEDEDEFYSLDEVLEDVHDIEAEPDLAWRMCGGTASHPG